MHLSYYYHVFWLIAVATCVLAAPPPPPPPPPPSSSPTPAIAFEQKKVEKKLMENAADACKVRFHIGIDSLSVETAVRFLEKEGLFKDLPFLTGTTDLVLVSLKSCMKLKLLDVCRQSRLLGLNICTGICWEKYFNPVCMDFAAVLSSQCYHHYHHHHRYYHRHRHHYHHRHRHHRHHYYHCHHL